MSNPFEVIESKLSCIENLLLDLKHKPKEVESPNHPEQLLTIQQAGSFLNLSIPTIYSKVSRNEIPYMKRGKRLYFSHAELLEYVKTGRKKTNSEVEAEANSYLLIKK